MEGVIYDYFLRTIPISGLQMSTHTQLHVGGSEEVCCEIDLLDKAFVVWHEWKVVLKLIDF